MLILAVNNIESRLNVTAQLSFIEVFCLIVVRDEQAPQGAPLILTPVQFHPGSADFHGGSNGVTEYDKEINVEDISRKKGNLK